MLLKSQQSAPLWPYPNAQPITATTADLAQIARGIVAGGLVLFDLADGAVPDAAKTATAAADTLLELAEIALEMVEFAESAGGGFFGYVYYLEAAAYMAAVASAATAAGATAVASEASTAAAALESGTIGGSFQAITDAIAAAEALLAQAAANVAGLVPTAGIVTSYVEAVWYANGAGPTPPGATNPPPIAIPHAEISFANGTLAGPWWPFVVPQITLRWGWLQVGQIVPVTSAASYVYSSGGGTLVVDPASTNPIPLAATPIPVMVEDPALNAASTTLTSTGSPAVASLGTLSPVAPPNGFASPLEIFFNLVGVSRGKTVATETLGSGNPMVAGQDFTLAQSPVTYFFDPASVSGPNFSSTVSVSVNGVAWQEVQSFYGQPKNAQIFVLHEDDQSQTHVAFGDGVNGSLPPTGTNNIVATYRYGGGASRAGPRDADRGADADARPEGHAQPAARRPAGPTPTSPRSCARWRRSRC